MAELVLRLVLAAGAAAMQPQMLGPAAALYGTAAVLAFIAQRREMWPNNAAMVWAAADAGVLSAFLFRTGYLGNVGFLSLLPVFWARQKHRAPVWTSIGAAIAVAGVAAWMLAKVPPTDVLLQAACVLALGMIPVMQKPTGSEILLADLIIEPERQEFELELAAPIIDHEDSETRIAFKELQSRYNEIELRSRRDRLSSRLLRTYLESVDAPYSALTNSLMDEVGAEGLTLYALPPTTSRLVVQSVSGRVPEKVKTEAFDAPAHMSEGQLKHKLHKLTHALREPNSMLTNGSVVLKYKGRVVGLLSLFHSNSRDLDRCIEKAELAAEAMGSLLVLHMERQSLRRQMKRLELMHAAAAVGDGADNLAALADRMVRELWPALDLDHLSIHLIEDGEAFALAKDGAVVDPLAALSFGFGPGLGGWLRSGAPELALFDARSDMRLEREEAIRLRLGSIVIEPLGPAGSPVGYLCATTHRVHAIGEDELEAIRGISADLGRAMTRLVQPTERTEGIATATEFRQAVADADFGSIIQIEPLRMEEMKANAEPAAIEAALRAFAIRIKNTLPSGGMVCRRETGAFAILLRGWAESEANRWANECVASASFIAVPTRDGSRKIPLAGRARAAALPNKTSAPNEQVKA